VQPRAELLLLRLLLLQLLLWLCAAQPRVLLLLCQLLLELSSLLPAPAVVNAQQVYT
jgi:hypothetical protein